MRELNNFEKLSLLLSAQIAGKMDDYYVDPKLVAELVRLGHEWALSWEYDFLEKEPHSKDQIVDETVKILEMFQHLQRSENEIHGGVYKTVHRGFDGNNDYHFGVAKVLVGSLDRFTDIEGAGSNSHSAGTVGQYQSKLSRYEPIRDRLLSNGQYNLMSEAEINIVLGITS